MTIKTEPTSQSLDFQSNFGRSVHNGEAFFIMLLQIFLWQCNNQWL